MVAPKKLNDDGDRPVRYEPVGKSLLPVIRIAFVAWILLIAGGAWYFNGMSTYRLVVALVPGLLLAAIWAVALRGLKPDKQ